MTKRFRFHNTSSGVGIDASSNEIVSNSTALPRNCYEVWEKGRVINSSRRDGYDIAWSIKLRQFDQRSEIYSVFIPKIVLRQV